MHNIEKMNDCGEYDKTIIELDMANANFNDANVCDFYVDILDSIRNVEYIKIMKCSVGVKPKQALANGSYYNDGDSIYVVMNDYKRISAIQNSSVFPVFETVDVNLTETYHITTSSSFAVSNSVLYTKEYTPVFEKQDVSVYKLNPTEPNLKRFNIQLYDKTNKIMRRSDIARFKILLCLYSNQRKF